MIDLVKEALEKQGVDRSETAALLAEVSAADREGYIRWNHELGEREELLLQWMREAGGQAIAKAVVESSLIAALEDSFEIAPEKLERLVSRLTLKERENTLQSR